jgi:hypothetical protein
MIIDAIKIITIISEDEITNTQNYMEGLNYMDNLFNFLNKLKIVVPIEKVEFLPSFKGKYIVEKLGIASDDKENEMKIFRVKSNLFFEDEVLLRLQDEMKNICEQIEKNEDLLTFYLP